MTNENGVIPPITIRDADPGHDLGAVVALNKLVQELHAKAEPAVFRPSDDMPGIETFHLEFMTGEDKFAFVAEVDGAVVGYVCGAVQKRPSHTFAWKYERLAVDQIAVQPAYQRSGIGRALMNRVAVLADSLGMGEIVLDTWQFNAQARQFFEAIGYRVYNVRLRTGGRRAETREGCQASPLD